MMTTEMTFTAPGEPESLTAVRRELGPVEPGRARVRVEATGVSAAEQALRRGKYYAQPPFPLVPGYDLVGIVEELGGPDDRLRVGQRVAALTLTGGWAEQVVLPADTLVPVPRAAGRRGGRDRDRQRADRPARPAPHRRPRRGDRRRPRRVRRRRLRSSSSSPCTPACASSASPAPPSRTASGALGVLPVDYRTEDVPAPGPRARPRRGGRRRRPRRRPRHRRLLAHARPGWAARQPQRHGDHPLDLAPGPLHAPLPAPAAVEPAAQPAAAPTSSTSGRASAAPRPSTGRSATTSPSCSPCSSTAPSPPPSTAPTPSTTRPPPSAARRVAAWPGRS